MRPRFGAIARGPALAGALACAWALALAASAAAGAKAWPLKVGSTGDRVKLVQQALHQQADGRYGRHTADAVKRFQERHGLTGDGEVGHTTWSALVHAARGHSSSRHGHGHAHGARHHHTRAHHTPAHHTPASHTRAHHGHRARVSTRGAVVRMLQRHLGLHADGVFGPGTRRAVTRLQSRHGLSADGVVGPATWHALGIRGSHAVLRSGRRHTHRVVRHAHGPPAAIARAMAGADRIAHLPYVFGGGHGSFHASGYDCSGSVSYVLHAAHVLAQPLDSSQLMSYGSPGRGRWITVYANPGHAFMVINGHRFDTGDGQSGSRWQVTARSASGYVVRHPPGL